jgi:hypothetical protein
VLTPAPRWKAGPPRLRNMTCRCGGGLHFCLRASVTALSVKQPPRLRKVRELDTEGTVACWVLA